MKSFAFQVPPLKGNLRIQPETLDTQPAVTPGVSAVSQLEAKVSLLQIAKGSLKRMGVELSEMKTFIEESLEKGEPMPHSLVESFVSERILRIKGYSETASFLGQTLLNGGSGVWGQVKGEGLRFVRGSALAQSSEGQGYAVAIENAPKAANLLGREPATPESLRKESLIVLREGQQEVHYRVERGITLQGLIEGLQTSLWKGGIDVSVYLAADGRLAFLHNKLGRKPKFQGMSLKTRLVSHLPGSFVTSLVGEDVQGRIGGEVAQGEGGFLQGDIQGRTSGLTLYYQGKLSHSGQVVGFVQVIQKGMLVPLDGANKTHERLSLPALTPQHLGIGVSNRSGFGSLEEIQVKTLLERLDALRILEAAQGELTQMSRELKQKEEAYVDLAIKLLQEGANPKEAGEELLSMGKEKAAQMAKELRYMLRPKDLGGSDRMA